MSGQEWFTAAELAGLALPGLPTSKRGVQFHAAREGWSAQLGPDREPLTRPRSGRGGGVEYHLALLPEAARARMMRPSKTNLPAVAVDAAVARESAWSRYERLTTPLKAEAARRLAAVQQVESLIRAGLGKSRAVDEVVSQAAREARASGAKPPFSTGTLYDWFRRIHGADLSDRLAFLAPDYVGRTTVAECSDEALLLFKSEYLTNSRQSAAAAHRKVAYAAAENGWAAPSVRAMVSRLEREVPAMVRVYLREGDAGLARRFPTPRRDVSELSCLQAVNVDGHQLDLFVKWTDGSVGRPMMIAIQDIYSRRMLVTHLCQSESVAGVRQAFAQLIRHHGIPEEVIFDNGKAFASKWLTGGQPQRFRHKILPEDQVGVLTKLGCRVHFTTPYWGRAKPIERAFGGYADGFVRSAVFAGAYTGRSPLHKPEDYNTRAIPIAQLAVELESFVARDNAQLGRKSPMAGGKLSHDQVWDEGIARGHLIRAATQAQMRLAMLAAEGVTVRRGTCQLHLAGNIYWSEHLWDHEGSKVIVRFDESDLHAGLAVYRLDGAYICEAACVESVGFLSMDAAKDIGRLKGLIRKAAKVGARQQGLLTARQLALGVPTDGEDSTVVEFTPRALQLEHQPDQLTSADAQDHHAIAMERAFERMRVAE